MAAPIDTLVTVFGGSGFLGRHVVRALAKREYRIRVASRRPELAGHLQPLGRVGQIHNVQANIRNPASIKAAMRDASIVVNLVGILTEGGKQSFDAVQAQGAGAVAQAAAEIGARMVHVSAIGADANSESAYSRTKAVGEQNVLAAVPSASILRPSLVFGPEDSFTTGPHRACDAGVWRRDEDAAGVCWRRRPRGGRCGRWQDQAGRRL
jgi:uncharacterized protein YbjT (DUF2867 family)